MAEELVLAARARTDEARLEVLIELAHRRVAEAGAAARSGRHDAAAELAQAYRDVVRRLHGVVSGLPAAAGEQAATRVARALELLAGALERAAAGMRAAQAPLAAIDRVEGAAGVTRRLDAPALRTPPPRAGGAPGGGRPVVPPVPGRRR
ncbi:MAG: hypothetical protein M9894_02640 [Planctomycetes bacterium]|nr:hypothetical protein [Planctomycetota bacterium]